MSRLANIVDSPVVKTFKWKNRKEVIQKDDKGKALKDDKGKPITEVERETGWYYWDKSLNDGEGAEVKLELPFTFLWLESAFSIMGFHKNREKGIYSTEVLDLKTQPLIVKCENDILAEGLYKNIKDEVKGVGGKFCSAIYVLMKNDGEWEVCRFLMAGSSNSAWIEFSNRTKNKTHAIACYDTKEKYTPKGDMYEEPVFKYLNATEEMIELADKAAEEQIDPFFKYYLSRPVEKTEEPAHAETTNDSDYDN